MTPEGTERANRSSVKLTRNTKGYGFEVHIYAGDTEDIDGVLLRLHDTVTTLNAQYPREGE